MSFKVNPVREKKFHHKTVDTDGTPIEFSVTFNFICSEDIDYAELRKKIENKEKLSVEDENGKISEVEMGTYNAFLYTLRTSLTDWEGITDLEGKPLAVRNDKGEIIIAHQKAVFEAIRTLPTEEGQQSLMDKITIAYTGYKGKN